MKTNIEKAENGYTVRFMDEYWTEDRKRTETGRGYRTTTQTLRVYPTLDAAFADIAKFYGVIYTSVEQISETADMDKVKELCIRGLLTDGAHHKQWCLERILPACGFNLKDIACELAENDYEWESGTVP